MKKKTITIDINGHKIRLVAVVAGRCDSFRAATAKFSHATRNTVTFKDAAGNYADVVGVRNAGAWLKRHGYVNSLENKHVDT